MSLFIKVESPGREERIIPIREHAASFGEDGEGVFGSTNLCSVWFSIFAHDDEYFLQLHNTAIENGASFAGDASSRNDQLHLLQSLTNGIQLLVPEANYTFTFATTPEEAAVLAVQLNTDEIATSPLQNSSHSTLSVELADSRKSFPLYNGVQVTLGSDESDLLRVDFEGIESAHALIAKEEETVRIVAKNGALIVNGKEIQVGEEEIVSKAVCRLLPSKIEFSIEEQR